MIDKKMDSSLSLSLSLIAKKHKGFTLAEILLSLSIIGIVVAIALPSLLGNVHERAFETQKKALYTRFSQALPLLPSLNGYGEYSETTSNNTTTVTDTTAETFVRDGLSKVMKITNICDNEHLGDCGLPDEIIPMDGSSTQNISKFSRKIFHLDYYKRLNAVAFETVNGESILVNYNSDCITKPEGFDYVALGNMLPRMCANFIYDLNGKKGPNTAGKDIGIITAFYAIDPIVVAPNPHPSTVKELTPLSFEAAKAKCKDLDAKIPDLHEGISICINEGLIAPFLMRGRNDFYVNYKAPGREESYWEVIVEIRGCYLRHPHNTDTVICAKR